MKVQYIKWVKSTIERCECYAAICVSKRKEVRDFPGGPVVKNPPGNAGDTGSSPGPGRSHMPRSN